MDKKEKRMNIENTKNEIISIYDENDNYVGKDSRINMRKNNLIHRCTTILILNQKNEILVQTRALTKEYCPGYMSDVTGGIVCEGETVESNAQKELEEELGIDISKTKNKLQFLRKYFYEEKNICKVWIYEFFIRITDDEAKNIKFKDHEVSKIDWFTKDSLLKIYSDPNSKITSAGKQIIKELEDKQIL